jgi:hypothetical protein
MDMDVTPTPVMYAAFSKIADMAMGDAPGAKDMGPGAMKRREARHEFMSLMHQLTAMTMREGARRAFEERGMLTVAAPLKGQYAGH